MMFNQRHPDNEGLARPGPMCAEQVVGHLWLLDVLPRNNRERQPCTKSLVNGIARAIKVVVTPLVAVVATTPSEVAIHLAAMIHLVLITTVTATMTMVTTPKSPRIMAMETTATTITQWIMDTEIRSLRLLRLP